MNPPLPAEVAYILLIPVALGPSYGLHWLMEGFTRLWCRSPRKPEHRGRRP